MCTCQYLQPPKSPSYSCTAACFPPKNSKAILWCAVAFLITFALVQMLSVIIQVTGWPLFEIQSLIQTHAAKIILRWPCLSYGVHMPARRVGDNSLIYSNSTAYECNQQTDTNFLAILRILFSVCVLSVKLDM